MGSMRGRLSAMLRLFGALGLVVALALLPYGLAAVGLTFRSPLFYGIVAHGYAPAIVAILGALLFVSGRRGGVVGAGLCAAIVIGYLVASWRAQLAVAQSGDPQVLFTLVLAMAVCTAAVSVYALVFAPKVRVSIEGEPETVRASG
ncbi:MAG: hypothetical protein D9V44_09735 [Actinobacteria bacterium]|nr:MAG: hypothetical protein D9V44_09735 [Actinomycetota bacterium]